MPGRRRIVAGNWKLNKTVAETRTLIRELRNRLAGIDVRAEVVVCPSFVSLETAVDAAAGSVVKIGAQDVFWEASGAYTGEVSAEMLLAVGALYALVGHSERRHVFGETDRAVNRKTLKLVSMGLTPIVCVGETLEERETGNTETVVASQIRAGLENLAPDHATRLVLAYEPVWAIGTGRTAAPGEANNVHALIRGLLADMFGSSVARDVRILYGGSVTPDNAGDLVTESDIDGVLVGGASLDAQSFAQIIAS